jgi:hypothetical protein
VTGHKQERRRFLFPGTQRRVFCRKSTVVSEESLLSASRWFPTCPTFQLCRLSLKVITKRRLTFSSLHDVTSQKTVTLPNLCCESIQEEGNVGLRGKRTRREVGEWEG